jgi:hypothetical protein
MEALLKAGQAVEPRSGIHCCWAIAAGSDAARRPRMGRATGVVDVRGRVWRRGAVLGRELVPTRRCIARIAYWVGTSRPAIGSRA